MSEFISVGDILNEMIKNKILFKSLKTKKLLDKMIDMYIKLEYGH